VKAAIERQSAMVHENQTDGCLPRQNCTARNRQTRLRHKGTGSAAAELAPLPPGMPPPPPADSEGTQSSGIEGVPVGFVYIHTPLPNTRFFDVDAYAKDRMCDKDFIPDLLTDEKPSAS